jgi:hypothetical protein
MASGSGNKMVQAVYTGDDATHRSTFARAVPEWKKWFDSLGGNSSRTKGSNLK